MITKTKSTALLGLAVLLAAPTAHAADLRGDKMEATFGAGVVYGRLCAGSDESQAILVPVLSVQRDILLADSTRGAGLQYQLGNGLYLSQSIYNAYAAGVRWEHEFGYRWMGIAQINAMRYAHGVSGSYGIERRNSVFGNVALT